MLFLRLYDFLGVFELLFCVLQKILSWDILRVIIYWFYWLILHINWTCMFLTYNRFLYNPYRIRTLKPFFLLCVIPAIISSKASTYINFALRFFLFPTFGWWCICIAVVKNWQFYLILSKFNMFKFFRINNRRVINNLDIPHMVIGSKRNGAVKIFIWALFDHKRWFGNNWIPALFFEVYGKIYFLLLTRLNFKFLNQNVFVQKIGFAW